MCCTSDVTLLNIVLLRVLNIKLRDQILNCVISTDVASARDLSVSSDANLLRATCYTLLYPIHIFCVAMHGFMNLI
jgi:hypothetical protein